MDRKPSLDKNVFIDFDAFLERCRDYSQPQTMPSFQDLVQGPLRAKPSTQYRFHYFISHRWDSQVYPDPTGWQWSSLYDFAVEIKESRSGPACFWYDFSCLPQGIRTSEEQIFFDTGLKTLNDLSVQCETIALVSGQGEFIHDFQLQLKRGWILCELLIAIRSGRWVWTFHETDGEIISACKARNLSGRFNQEVKSILRTMPVYDANVLLDWLSAEGVECTNGSDLNLIANRMAEFGFSRNSSSNVPKLQPGVIYKMTADEIWPYYIDENGWSPIMPGYVCECEYSEDGIYTLIFKPRP
jgi:hypothetical protein